MGRITSHLVDKVVKVKVLQTECLASYQQQRVP